MCELLGLAFNEPVTSRISFYGFCQRSSRNPDGWGLAWFADGQALVRKEPLPANISTTASRLEQNDRISSTIFIGHVRLASCGDLSLENTHPFQMDFHGVSVVFAHNGTLRNLPAHGPYKPLGATDSEQAFCHLLSWMDDQKISFSDYTRLESRPQQLNGYGNMNLLFSNGSELFAYRDRRGYNGLCLTYRKAPFMPITLRDPDWQVNLAGEKRPSEEGFVIATKPLTDEPWIDLKCGSLLVIRSGKVQYGDPRT